MANIRVLKIYKKIFIVIGIFILLSEFCYAQDYQFNLRQRRSYDRINIEIWVKSLTNTPTKLGYASLVLEYNTNFLTPSLIQSLTKTDSVHYDIDQDNPIIDISSPFDNMNGYQSLNSGAYNSSTYSLEITLANLGQMGIEPSTEGMGTFVGLLSFDIINHPSAEDTTGITWSNDFPGDTRVFSADSSDIESQIELINPEPFTVLGVTILSPSKYGQVIDRDKDYASMKGNYEDKGYPIYFERSLDPTIYPYDSQDLAYSFEYSLDDGETWIEIGRTVAVTLMSLFQDEAKYLSGDLAYPNTVDAYIITTQHGTKLEEDNIRSPLRTIWNKDLNYTLRSEEGRLRITQLEGTGQQDIILRNKSDVVDVSDSTLVIGRLFFAQLNGNGQYFRTKENYSNPTQLTVEAWVNMNSFNPAGEDPGIVVSSGGKDATPVLGSTEGAWMLYLKDGKHPAFRVREILGRGKDGYLASIVAWDTLLTSSDASPLVEDHSANWVHIAGTVENNTVSLYVNGERVDSYINNEDTDIRMLTTQHPIWIAANPNDTASYDILHAGIKGVRIWRVALSQDEIRRNVAGVINPADKSDFTNTDIRKGLDMYYSFEGSIKDLANELDYQKGEQDLEYYNNDISSDYIVKYRPDKPHIHITSPAPGAGVKNKEEDIFEIRWVSYGLGDIENEETKDIVIEYSLDNGENWFFAKNARGIEYDTLLETDIEYGIAYWEPYENNNSSANLRSIEPYSKPSLLKIRGTKSNSQDDLSYVSQDITVAPYFAMLKDSSCLIEIPGNQGLNVIHSEIFIESWICPYFLPSDTADFMPILSKLDSTAKDLSSPLGYNFYYDLRINRKGQLIFSVEDTNHVIQRATSDITKPIIRPNSYQYDTVWTHIGVYLDTKDGIGQSEVIFYIDGIPQLADSIKHQLGEGLNLDPYNDYPTYLGYYPGRDTTIYWVVQAVDPDTQEPILDDFGNPTYDTLSRIENKPGIEYIGEFRGLRLWNGRPNNSIRDEVEPSEMTKFIQGALSIRGEELTASRNRNLYADFSMDEGKYISNGFNRALCSSNNSMVRARVWKEMYKYIPVKPYVKLIEPVFRQIVSNTDTSLRVRWVGFEYNGALFSPGYPNAPPSIEFSYEGGGGNQVQPYQHIAGFYWKMNESQTLFLPSDDDRYSFDTGNNEVFYAARLNVSMADPDENDDGIEIDQGPLSASLTNARFRLRSFSTINGVNTEIFAEGPLFTITPASNFTVRVLLEGYHKGYTNGLLLNSLGETYDEGGLRITLFQNNSGGIGESEGSAESIYGYDDRDPKNRADYNNRFANVNFVYTELNNGNYWVLVEHVNHLPIMSRIAAPFKYIGDDRTTWEIESGWDFQTWNGVDDNVISDLFQEPWKNGLFTARGDAISTETNIALKTTGLIYNDGASGTIKASMAAMVGGDCEKDGVINAADRVRVRIDEGTSSIASDITGDGFVNADDRTIVDRNFTRSASISFDTDGIPTSICKPAEDYISPLDKTLSEKIVSNYKKLKSGIFSEPTIQSERKYKKHLELQSSLSYRVTGDVYIDEAGIDIKVYIEGTGDEFNLANCTFSIQYNPAAVKFSNLIKEETIIYDAVNNINNGNDANEYGYWGVNYAPQRDIETGQYPANSIDGVHSIEISFDASQIQDNSKTNKFPGLPLPNGKTYLGTMRFSLVDQKGSPGFRWHESSSVHAVNEGIVTEAGEWVEFENMRMYDYTLTAPTGGEVYSENDTYDITWVTDGNDLVNLLVSLDGGASWEKLNDEPINIIDGKYTWTTPTINSTECLIRIVTVSDEAVLDESGYFSIMSDFANIIRPKSEIIPLSGGVQDSIIWQAAGYDKVRFEFSSDNGNEWNVVADNVDYKLGSIIWSIPRVTTKNAKVRMVDITTGNVIDITGTFKILVGKFIFRNPAEGEIIYNDIAEKSGGYRLRWNSVDIDEFDLKFSIDGGSSWWSFSNGNDNNIKAKAKEHYVMPDKLSSNNCYFAAIYDGDIDMKYAISERFELLSRNSIEELPDGCSISEAYPNPTSSIINFDMVLTEYNNISIEIIDESGKKVISGLSYELTAGEHILPINIEALTSGNYFVYISSDNIKAMKKITVAK